MSGKNYWQSVTQRRISRRRGIVALGGATAAAAFLAACGGDDGESPGAGPTAGGQSGASPSGSGPAGTGGGSTGAASGLVHTPAVSEGKPGGVLKHYTGHDVVHFDPVADHGPSPITDAGRPFYPRLLRFEDVPYPAAADGSSTGEVAESWEVSPDTLSVTMKIRPGMPWDRREPTNGRPINAEDVIFCWEKFRSVNANANSLAYDAEIAPDSPIESMSAPDSETLIVTLHQPNADILALLSGNFFIMPIESDSSFDPRTTVRGHGPWLQESYTPSIGSVWVRNPDYYITGRPFPDRVEVPIIPEQAQRLAQFKAGQIYTDVVGGSQQDVIPTKKDSPDVLMIPEDNYPASLGPKLRFGWNEGVPWRDKRVRQAVSMLVDREAWADVLDNRESFAKEGVDLDFRFNSVITGAFEGYWMDPTDTATFGPSSQYLTLNIEEAKRLLAAASVEDGYSFDLHIGPLDVYGTAYGRAAELYTVMLAAGGLKATIAAAPTQAEWHNNYGRVYRSSEIAKAVAEGKDYGFHGMSMVGVRSYPTMAEHLRAHFNVGGGGYFGMTPDPAGDVSKGDPYVNDMTVKISQEYELQAQIDLSQELCRYLTDQSYTVPVPTAAKGFNLWWPILGNVGAHRSALAAGIWVDVWREWWIDGTKPPVA